MLCPFSVSANLRDGLVDIHPAGQRVYPEVLRLLAGHGVCDGGVGSKVIVVGRHSQKASPDHRVFTKEVYEERILGCSTQNK